MPKTTYMWDELSDNVAAEYEDGVLSASYTHEPGLYGNLLSQNRNGVTSYYHYDGRGDTVALTDDSGNVTDTKEYDAWGNVLASTGSTVTPYQFGGRHGYRHDANPGLINLRSRFWRGWCNCSTELARTLTPNPSRRTNSYSFGRDAPNGRKCFLAGTELLRTGCESSRAKLGAPFTKCYTPEDVGLCFAKLDAAVAPNNVFGTNPCARSLLTNWLSLIRGLPAASATVCPTECLNALRSSSPISDLELSAVNRSLRDYSSCNGTGHVYGLHEFGGPCRDPFDEFVPFGLPSDLAISIGAIDGLRFRVDAEYDFGDLQYRGPLGSCCCLCRLDGKVKARLTDVYDFKSTLGANSSWFTHCAAIIEDDTGIVAKTKCEWERPLKETHCVCYAPAGSMREMRAGPCQ